MELEIIRVNSQEVNPNKNNTYCNVKIQKKTTQRSKGSKISAPKSRAEKRDEHSQKAENSNVCEEEELLSAFLFEEDRRYNTTDFEYNFCATKCAVWLKMCPFGIDENSKIA